MLKLSVGYQHNPDSPFSSVVERYKDSIEEVYFSWIDQPSGRSVLGGCDGFFDYSLQAELVSELKRIRSLGVKLNLLFNANCYGDDAMSRVLEKRILSVIDYLEYEGLCPEGITTTSPAVAYMLRQNRSDIEIKASVNMRIGSVEGMSYVSELFDSFCLQKECNRDLSLLAELYSYAKKQGKKITLLANSGCLYNCSGQIFHDNMVAHEGGIAKQKNIDFLPYTCYRVLREPENRSRVLKNTWIRPEDVGSYEGLCDSIKLATRMHALPAMVIDAYARRKYSGNLLDLFEPGHGPLLAPFILDNSRFPNDWFQTVTHCNKKCHECGYCDTVAEKVFIDSGEM